jgi:predicted outer membrane repeat protein
MQPEPSVTDASDKTELPDLLPEQVGRFTFDTLKAKAARHFDPRAALHALRTHANKPVVAIDIGGDKAIVALYGSWDGHFVRRTNAFVRRGDGGSGYVDLLEQIAKQADWEGLSVGISYAGPTDGTRIVGGPNLPAFLAEFHHRYDGDFGNLFPSVAVANDAEAGIMAGALEAAKRYPATRNVLYVINGSGLGGAVLTQNTIFAAEPGHIEVEDRLNPFRQQKACGILGATHVCLEAVGASKAGIEDIWFQKKGERCSGKEIAAQCAAGDPLALHLYDNSALVTAHAVIGMGEALNLADNLDDTVVVAHGGIFQVRGYCERVRSILEKGLFCTPELIFTKDFSDNTCLDGGAIAATLNDTGEQQSSGPL